jgi:hypothetical protein
MSVSDLKKASETNWKRIEAMTDEEIDTSDIPPLDESFFDGAKLHIPEGNIVRIQVGSSEELEEEEGDEAQASSFFEYLATPNGHEVAKDVVKLFADFKNAVLDKTLQEKQHLLEYQKRVQTWMWFVQILVFTLALGLVGFLTYVGKFDPAIAILLGTLVGYFFGKGIKS